MNQWLGLVLWGLAVFLAVTGVTRGEEFSPYGAEVEVVREEYGLWEEYEVERETQPGVEVEFVERRDWWNEDERE